MANTIRLKKSAVTGKVPLPADLAYGELALNYVDGLLYYKDSSNIVRAIGTAAPGAGATSTVTSKTFMMMGA